MRIQNTSHFRTAFLRNALRFLKPRCKHHQMADLVVVDQLPGKLTGGYSRRKNPLPTRVAPSLVELAVSRGLQYPQVDLHVPQLGYAVFRGQQEEVLFVLAHELRHIDQMWDGFTGTPEEAELDAEAFAFRCLTEAQQKGL